MRVPQRLGDRGSLKWIQRLTGSESTLLSDGIRASLNLPASWRADWKSPVQEDGYAEYRDAAFLELLGLDAHIDALRSFWPSGGPQWDALGVSNDGGVVLLEAKAHVPELVSHCAAEAESSLNKIRDAFAQAKRGFGATDAADWMSPYYQYANRLAHLWLLRSRGVDARMVFLYFVGDAEMRGPDSRSEWEAELPKVYKHLGLNRKPLNVADVFIDVRNPDRLAAV